jgi:hypothetical protein
VGFPEVSKVMEAMAEADPRKLAHCTPALVRELENCEAPHQILILGLLLSISLVTIDPIVAVLNAVTEMCAGRPHLFVPLFKLLTVVGLLDSDLALSCLTTVAKIARSGMVRDASDQTALLDCVDILKDKSLYCNIFHVDTLRAFGQFAGSNPVALKNIGKSNIALRLFPLFYDLSFVL